jgi:hypothetical protein
VIPSELSYLRGDKNTQESGAIRNDTHRYAALLEVRRVILLTLPQAS